MQNQQQLSELALWAILIGIATGSALLLLERFTLMIQGQ